jgi:hypothetical protein
VENRGRLAGTLEVMAVATTGVLPRDFDDRDEQRLADVWLWLHAVATQSERFKAGWPGWMSAFTVPPPPTGTFVAQVRIDAHFLVVAADHLAVSLGRLGRRRREFGIADLDRDLRRQIRVARNAREHWDRHRDGVAVSGRRRQAAGAQPGEIRLEVNRDGRVDFILFGVLSLQRLDAEIARLTERVAPPIEAITERRRGATSA